MLIKFIKDPDPQSEFSACKVGLRYEVEDDKASALIKSGVAVGFPQESNSGTVEVAMKPKPGVTKNVGKSHSSDK